MIDLKREIERELSLTDPPDLWDRIQADASNSGDAAVLDLATTRHRRRPSLWLAVAAVTVLLALVGALALIDDGQTVDTTPATDAPAVSEPRSTIQPPSLEDLGQFRAANVIVKIQCTDTRTAADSSFRDLIYAGVVTDNPDKLSTLDGVAVALGDLVGLIIREDRDGGRRVTLFGYDGAEWYGGATINSCDELVESVPLYLDGGYFYGIPGGYEILLPGSNANP